MNQPQDGTSSTVSLSSIAVPLTYEIEDSISMLLASVDMWRVKGLDATGPASMLYATGIEKLMKIVLIFDSRTGGHRISKRQLERVIQHNLAELFTRLTNQGLWVSGIEQLVHGAGPEDIPADPDIQRLLQILAHCSGSARYRNLNAVVRPEITLDNPLRDFQQLQSDFIRERTVDYTSHEAVREAGRESVQRIVVALRRWARGVCRIFTLGRISSEGGRFLNSVGPFLYLRDEQLGEGIEYGGLS